MKRWLVAAGALAVIAIAWWLWPRRHGVPMARDLARAGRSVDRPAPRGGDEAAPAPAVVDDDPRGDLRLEGQVVDAADHPVTGATVVLGSNPPRTATTAADGGFAFDALVGRPYTLIARAAQGIAGPVTARLTSKSDPVILHLRPAPGVVVTVIGLDKQPIDGATVELRGADTQRATTKAGSATFAAVVRGPYQLVAWADGTAKVYQPILVGSGEQRARIVLVAGAPVSGRVIDERGHAVAGAVVVVAAPGPWNRGGDGATTTVDGAFRFDAVAAGSVQLRATHHAYAPGSSGMMTFDGKTERSGITITLSDGATVHGRVLDTARAPVAGARVRIAGGRMFAQAREAYSDGSGAFEIRGLPRQELVAIAMHETGSSQTQQIDATRGDPPAIELVLDQTGTISGVVVDPDGNALEGVQVTAVPAAPGQRLRGASEELTDGAGRFALTGLADGDYHVTASRSRAMMRGRRGAIDGALAHTGQRDLKIVLQPEGGVKGKVVFGDGTVPPLYTVALGMTQQSFLGDDTFEIDSLAPQTYELNVRGPFQTKAVEVMIEPGKIADVGTIVVVKGRTLGGIVVANGSPVPNASVYAGLSIIGNGLATGGQLAARAAAQGMQTATTEADGTFSLSGFFEGDLAIVAEADAIGRSKAQRVPTDMVGQGDLVLELMPFGALSGTLRQNNAPAEGVRVTCQSTTTPNAVYTVVAGANGAYRFDRLAPDTYKVSATLGTPRTGMHFYSKQVDVPIGAEVTVDLVVEPGAITLDVAAAPRAGTLGTAAAWLASGVIAASTASALALQMAAQGAGSSAWAIIRQGAPAEFDQLVPGAYSACVVPLPTQVRGPGALSYLQRHADKLPAFCLPVTVAPSPTTQSATVPVEIPAYLPDQQGSGSGG